MVPATLDPITAPPSSAKLLEMVCEALEKLTRAEDTFETVISLESGRALTAAQINAKNVLAYVYSQPKPTFMAERHEESQKSPVFPDKLLTSVKTYLLHLRLDNHGKLLPEELTDAENLEEQIEATLVAAKETTT